MSNMGTDLSTQKNRTVSPCDEGMTLRIRNNFCALHFHQVHGDNVKLKKNRAVAFRSEGFCKGIVFSDRPVAVCEPIYIKFLEISSNWSGALRIGFTMNNPVSMKSKLPRYACPDLTSMPGNWAKAIAERMAKKDSILYYYVDPNGDVHYGLDSEEHGVFFGGINTSAKLWAVIDIYGNTVAIEFIDPKSLNPEHVSDLHSNQISPARTKENHNTYSSKYSTLSFHTFHGKNVLLETMRTVASRKPGFENLAYVFTERSLKVGASIALEVLQTSIKSNKKLVFGITSCNPSTLSPIDLPDVEEDLLDRPEYWVVESDSNVYDVGDIIIYNISLEGKLTVRKNYDEKSTELHIDPSQPLWLFFNLAGLISEVRLLGTSSSDVVSDFENMKISSELNMEPGTSGQQSFSECVICFSEPVDCAVYRCGHMCMCYGCAFKMWTDKLYSQCPICREAIQDVIKIYR